MKDINLKLWIVPISVIAVSVVIFAWGISVWTRAGLNVPYTVQNLSGAGICLVLVAVLIIMSTIAETGKVTKVSAPMEMPEKVKPEKTEEKVTEPKKTEKKKIPEERKEKEDMEEEMVICGACGAIIPASSEKCPNCGAEFEE